MKAVVTGASGLLGRQVVKAFENANCEGYKKTRTSITGIRYANVNLFLFRSGRHSFFTGKWQLS